MPRYTSDQEKLVLRILSHRPPQYYEILGVSKTATDGEIKTSYRKIALKLHPDKNSHPRASEAFQLLNEAWEVLGDPSKKNIFDQTGSNPSSRFQGHPGAGSSRASGFNGAFRNTGGFQSRHPFEEEIFNMFFGGQQPGATFSFGGNGFNFLQFGEGNPFAQFQQQRRAPPRKNRAQEQEAEANTLKQLAPLLIFLLITLLATLFSNDSEEYSMSPTHKFSVKRETPKYHIPFYVQPKYTADKETPKLRKLDRKIETEIIEDKKTMCNREHLRRNQMMEDAQGWFFTDEEMLKRAKEMAMPNCSELKGLGII